MIATGVPRQRITFAYDYLGRRVRKTVANWNGSAYITAVDRKFIYDGWNLIAELALNTSTSTFVLNSTYTWGLDLSKTLQDGGGVGGLLAIKLHAEPGAPVLLPAYDGNGNLAALVNRVGGALLAAYEYDAFGQTIRASGTHADKNNFRFSTKYTDSETGLLYYGYRYYNPTLGRWLGRDPIAEKGGLHLYGFVGNNGVNRWDLLWMRWVTRYRVDPNDPNEGQEAYQVWQEDAFIVAADRIENSGEWERLIDAYNDSILTTAYTSASTSTGAPSSGDSSVPDAPNKTDLSKLPGCSELRKQIDAGKSPALTAQSFIENKTGGGVFRGDNRGFTSSPADGVSATYRTTASVSWLNAPSGEAGITRIIGGLYSGQATPSVSGYVGIEQYMTGPGSYGYNRYIQYGQLSGSASDPFFSVMGHDFAPPAAHSISATMNYETGFASGTVTHTDFPRLQVFVGNQSVYNYSANANGKGSLDIYDKSTGQFSVPICDPSR